MSGIKVALRLPVRKTYFDCNKSGHLPDIIECLREARQSERGICQLMVQTDYSTSLAGRTWEGTLEKFRETCQEVLDAFNDSEMAETIKLSTVRIGETSMIKATVSVSYATTR